MSLKTIIFNLHSTISLIKTMRLHYLLFLSLTTSLTSATFFPNISSIPQNILPNTTSQWSSFLNLVNTKLGQTTTGISNLKNYFHQFGYIPQNIPLNFTDQYDDMLEHAIKTYQQNFNLNPTGQLDIQTLVQLIKPRCGNPDIINGTNTMMHANSLLHAVLHYNFFPGTPRWPQDRRDLTYAFHPGNQLTAGIKSVFTRAFARWSEVIPMTFTETVDFDKADMRIGFYVLEHGDGEPFDGVLGTLAHAFSPPSGKFHIDGDENWIVDGDVDGAIGAVHLESVAVHEIGHLLGLGHSSVEDAVMFPTISSATKKVQLHSDDVQGVQFLYGSNPNYDGSTESGNTTPYGQRDTLSDKNSADADRSSWSGLVFLVAVGLAALTL